MARPTHTRATLISAASVSVAIAAIVALGFGLGVAIISAIAGVI
jgi:hypothetical protein